MGIMLCVDRTFWFFVVSGGGARVRIRLADPVVEKLPAIWMIEAVNKSRRPAFFQPACSD